jgi:hypothetical protein
MKPKELIKAEIISQLHQQSINLLIDSLAEATAKIAELESALAEARKPKE